MRVVSSKIAVFASCGRYIFQNFIYETKIIICEYVVLQWLFIDIETDDLEWPWIFSQLAPERSKSKSTFEVICFDNPTTRHGDDET